MRIVSTMNSAALSRICRIRTPPPRQGVLQSLPDDYAHVHRALDHDYVSERYRQQ